MVIRKRVQVLLNIWLQDSEMTWVPPYPHYSLNYRKFLELILP